MLYEVITKLGAQRLDPLAEQSTVGLELGFTRATQADTAFLPLKVGPAAHQTRGQVLELSQFDLQLALVTLGPQGEDIENQCSTVDDAATEHALKVALLAGRQIMVEDDQVRLAVAQGIANFLCLALASYNFV